MSKVNLTNLRALVENELLKRFRGYSVPKKLLRYHLGHTKAMPDEHITDDHLDDLHMLVCAVKDGRLATQAVDVPEVVPIQPAANLGLRDCANAKAKAKAKAQVKAKAKVKAKAHAKAKRQHPARRDAILTSRKRQPDIDPNGLSGQKRQRRAASSSA